MTPRWLVVPYCTVVLIVALASHMFRGDEHKEAQRMEETDPPPHALHGERASQEAEVLFISIAKEDHSVSVYLQAEHDEGVRAAQAVADFFAAAHAQVARWSALARCETAGNWQMRGSTYSGGLGFFNGTWDAFGGREFASNAGLASPWAQTEIAKRVRDQVGLHNRPWASCTIYAPVTG